MQKNNMDKLLVIGAGSWGTAFGNYLSVSKNRLVKLWVREPELLDHIRRKHENNIFLKDVTLSPFLSPVSNLEAEAEEADILIWAVPSKYSRELFGKLKGIAENKIIVNLTKGFESTSLKPISQLAGEVLGPRIMENWVTITGPSFARELAAHHPTAVVACSHNETIQMKIQEEFSSDILRVYRNDDLIGIEVAGSAKNVMAIASGIIHGAGFGYNTTASLVTRASMEILRFGLKMGARKETFWGLAGIGDLMLTCFGPLSRNFQLGERIAKGETLEQIEESSLMVAEGVETTKAMKQLSDNLDIEMPITNEIYEILFNRKHPLEALKGLMKRSLKTEWNLS